jgi:hypothetical protein
MLFYRHVVDAVWYCVVREVWSGVSVHYVCTTIRSGSRDGRIDRKRGVSRDGRVCHIHLLVGAVG